MKSLLALAAALVVSLPSLALAQEADLADLRAAAKASPKEASAALALGRALRRAGRFAEADKELARGALLGTALKGGLATSLRYELARSRMDDHDAAGATRACEGVGKTGPLGDACRAEAFLVQNRATEALPLAERALAKDASLYEAKVAQGRALAQMGKVTDAEAALRAAIATADARPEAHRWLGAMLVAQAKRDAGLVELKKASSVEPKDPEVAFELGEALGATKEARDAFERATKIRPTFGAAHAELARVALELGDASAAETAANEALKQDATLSAARVVLARVRVAQGKWDEAIKEGEAAKKLVPNSAAAELAIADGHAGKGDIDLAVESYQKAFSLDRADPTPLLRATKAALAAGRTTTARGFADKVTSEFATLGPGWVALGEVAERQGDKARARTAYEAALKADGPVDKDAVKKRLAALK